MGPAMNPAIAIRGVRLAPAPIPTGSSGSRIFGWVSFIVADAIRIEDAPLVVCRDRRWFIGTPGGRLRGLGWSRDFDARLMTDTQRAGAKSTGDPEWPTRLLAQVAENPPRVAPATSAPPQMEN